MSYSTSIIGFGTLYFAIIGVASVIGCYALYQLIRLSRVAIEALKIYILKNKI